MSKRQFILSYQLKVVYSRCYESFAIARVILNILTRTNSNISPRQIQWECKSSRCNHLYRRTHLVPFHAHRYCKEMPMPSKTAQQESCTSCLKLNKNAHTFVSNYWIIPGTKASCSLWCLKFNGAILWTGTRHPLPWIRIAYQSFVAGNTTWHKTMVVPVTDHHVRCKLWVQVTISYKGICFVYGLKFFALDIFCTEYLRPSLWVMLGIC